MLESKVRWDLKDHRDPSGLQESGGHKESREFQDKEAHRVFLAFRGRRDSRGRWDRRAPQGQLE